MFETIVQQLKWDTDKQKQFLILMGEVFTSFGETLHRVGSSEEDNIDFIFDYIPTSWEFINEALMTINEIPEGVLYFDIYEVTQVAATIGSKGVAVLLNFLHLMGHKIVIKVEDFSELEGNPIKELHYLKFVEFSPGE